MPDQLIVETFEPNQYYEALAKGIKYVTFAGPYEEMIRVKAIEIKNKLNITEQEAYDIIFTDVEKHLRGTNDKFKNRGTKF